MQTSLRGILKNSNPVFTNECTNKSSKHCQGNEVSIFERSDAATKNKLQKPMVSSTAVKQADENSSTLKQSKLLQHSIVAVKLTQHESAKAPPSVAKKVTVSSPSHGSDIDSSNNGSIVSSDEMDQGNRDTTMSPKSLSSMFATRHQLQQKDNQPLKHCSESTSMTTGSCCVVQLTDAESSRVYANKFYDR